MKQIVIYPAVLRWPLHLGQDLKDRAAPKDRIQQFLFDSMGRLEQRQAGYGYTEQELEQKQVEEFAYNNNGQLIQAKNNESNLQ